MGDILCVDANFNSGQIDFWKAHGVKYPEQDKMYTVREVVTHTNGTTGIRLEEIINPKVPVKHSVLGVAEMEPTFRISRFRTLAGDKVKKEEIVEHEV